MIHICIVDHATGVQAHADIPSEFGPALRSTMLEHSNELGERSTGSFGYDKEDALMRAIAAFNTLRAAINEVVTTDDPFYE